MNTFRVKQFIQDRFATLGYELHRKRPAFQPYTEQVELAGVSFQFWIGDAIGKEWYDPASDQNFAELAEIARMVRPGDRVLEIGAHHGFTAMLLSKLVGERGSILAVEPSPFNAMMATAQVGLNRAYNCRVLQAAASDRKGSARISLDSNAAVTESPDGIEVPAITVDELDSMFGPFNVLKIDVEGFERQVLVGSAQLLERRPAILLELHSPLLSRFGSTIDSVLDLIPSYQGTFVTRNAIRARERVQAFPTEAFPADAIVNLFLCSP